ncbi:MAG: DMT family transporter [Rhizobiaceae bacterium]|nr:DMT family transporter [Rhizobiaceae bacterium]
MKSAPIEPGENNRLVLAAFLMFGAFLMFASMDTMAKYMAAQGLPTLQIVFTRFLAHFVIIVLFYLPHEGVQIFKSHTPKLQVLRGFGLLGSTVFNFAALAYLPLTVTTAIFFATPLVVCLLSIKILNETVGARRLTAVFVGFLGVLVTTQVWSADFHWAMLLSVAALLCVSFYFVLTRKIAGNSDSNAVSQIYASGLSLLFITPVAFYVWTTPSGPLQWVLLFMIGIFGAVGHTLLTIAHRFAQASTLAPLVYVQIIYATVLSWLVFGAIPNFWTVAGTAIIVGSGFYIWQRERKLLAADQ